MQQARKRTELAHAHGERYLLKTGTQPLNWRREGVKQRSSRRHEKKETREKLQSVRNTAAEVLNKASKGCREQQYWHPNGLISLNDIVIFLFCCCVLKFACKTWWNDKGFWLNIGKANTRLTERANGLAEGQRERQMASEPPPVKRISLSLREN